MGNESLSQRSRELAKEQTLKLINLHPLCTLRASYSQVSGQKGSI